MTTTQTNDQPAEFNDTLSEDDGGARVAPYVFVRCSATHPVDGVHCNAEDGHDRVEYVDDIDQVHLYDHVNTEHHLWWNVQPQPIAEPTVRVPAREWTQVATFNPTREIMLTRAFGWWANLTHDAVAAHGKDGTRVRHTPFGGLVLEVLVLDEAR